tara:strand:+ start:775 stop:1275 length:501 start_codon:yes stop_codon:yes gene_type:complete
MPSNIITYTDISASQAAWGNAVIAIGNAYGTASDWNAASASADAVLTTAYNYDSGRVLFRPTLTAIPHTFRNSKESAHSYFVSGAYDAYGFATENQWQNVKFESMSYQYFGNLAFSQGYVNFSGSLTGSFTTASSGVTVDKTFGYVKDDSGSVKIFLHYSAITNYD